jgi:hypothetical protein
MKINKFKFTNDIYFKLTNLRSKDKIIITFLEYINVINLKLGVGDNESYFNSNRKR